MTSPFPDFLLADDFTKAYYLNDRQKDIMRIRAAQAVAYQQDGDSKKAEIKRAFKDPKIYLSGLAQFGVDSALYGFSSFECPLATRCE